jgi:hypothetical protein
MLYGRAVRVQYSPQGNPEKPQEPGAAPPPAQAPPKAAPPAAFSPFAGQPQLGTPTPSPGQGNYCGLAAHHSYLTPEPCSDARAPGVPGHRGQW